MWIDGFRKVVPWAVYSCAVSSDWSRRTASRSGLLIASVAKRHRDRISENKIIYRQKLKSKRSSISTKLAKRHIYRRPKQTNLLYSNATQRTANMIACYYTDKSTKLFTKKSAIIIQTRRKTVLHYYNINVIQHSSMQASNKLGLYYNLLLIPTSQCLERSLSIKSTKDVVYLG